MKSNHLLDFFQFFIWIKQKSKSYPIGEEGLCIPNLFLPYSPLLKILSIKPHFSPGFAQGSGC